MNSLLIFASVLGVAYAGVVQLGPGEESEILNLYEKLCNGGGYSGGYGGSGDGARQLGGALVYCKKANGADRQSLSHRVNVPGSQGQDQIVFVKPRPVHYDHNIVVEGGDGKGQNTKIYVLPSKATHNVQTQVIPGSNQQQKPQVYFLGQDGSSGRAPQPSYGTPEIRNPSPSYGTPEIRTPSDSYGAPYRLQKRSNDGLVNYPVEVQFKN